MTTSATADPQTSLYETVVEDAELEAILEKRQKAKDSAKAVAKKAKDADAVARAALERLELGIGAAVRVGRFVVTLAPVAAKSVSFETGATTRLNIRPIPAETTEE